MERHSTVICFYAWCVRTYSVYVLGPSMFKNDLYCVHQANTQCKRCMPLLRFQFMNDFNGMVIAYSYIYRMAMDQYKEKNIFIITSQHTKNYSLDREYVGMHAAFQQEPHNYITVNMKQLETSFLLLRLHTGSWADTHTRYFRYFRSPGSICYRTYS